MCNILKNIFYTIFYIFRCVAPIIKGNINATDSLADTELATEL